MRPIDVVFPDSADPEAIRKAYILGYRAGYKDGQSREPDALKTGCTDETAQFVPIETMKLSTHAYNSLIRNGCRYVSDVAMLPAERIRIMKNVGKITIQEVIRALKECGITDTEWEYAWDTEL